MSKHLKADLSLLLMTAIWGSSFTLTKNVLDRIPSFAYLSLRFIIASAILIAVFYKKLKNINKKIVIYGCVVGLMLFGGMALQVSGLYFTSASNSAFITGMNVVMVPMFSAAILRKKPEKSSVIGVILACAGLFFLTGGLDFRFNVGDFLTLLCAVCFSLQIIFIDRYGKKHDPVLLSLIQIGFTALLSTVVWLFIDYKPVVVDSAVAVTLLITGVLGTALAYLVQTVAQKYTTPTHTALIFTAEPVFGALFALVIPNSAGTVETLSVNTVAGCVLILAGTLISELRNGRNNK